METDLAFDARRAPVPESERTRERLQVLARKLAHLHEYLRARQALTQHRNPRRTAEQAFGEHPHQDREQLAHRVQAPAY
ncbi:MAG: hypothetical protein IT529_12935 [Burkholderiales bacterium]|nr:hypothetical protein [Burkholderiales bacterium]